MRILVTGGAGFIGSHLVRLLLTDESADMESVTVLDKLTYAGDLTRLADVAGDPRLTIVTGDICDAALLADVLPGHDAVMNLAAESHVDRSIASACDFVRTNVLGVQALADGCRAAGVPTLLQVSTDEVYGPVPDGYAAVETDPLRPSSPYAASKAAGDLLALAVHVTHGLDVRISRCGNNFGPGQDTEKLIPSFVTSLLAGDTVGVYGDGHAIREWIHVSDHCRALLRVLRRGRPGGIYNIAGPTPLTNLELAHRLCELTDRNFDEAVRFVADRPGHDRRYALDDTLARSELGFKAVTDFEKALAETVTAYRGISG